MKTLSLYNAVTAKTGGEYKILPEYGVIVEPSASHALEQIKTFCKQQKLTGKELNATFHKSWKKIKDSSREELYIHQVIHYLTTYGTGHQSNFIYIPDEELEIPQVETSFLVVRGLENDEIVERSLELLKSGVALKQDTIEDILSVMVECGYSFTGEEDVKNKEALMFICQSTGVVPTNPVECVRYMVYLATGRTLLIKNKATYTAIANLNLQGKFAISNVLKKANHRKLAAIFNRFKPIFLELKKVLGSDSKSIINKISKLSKELHTPIPYNILNDIGSCSVQDLKHQRQYLLNANFFQLAKCLQYLEQANSSDCKAYLVRNGKMFSKRALKKKTATNVERKREFLMGLMKGKYDLAGLKIFIPEGVKYALPTSEKNFVGNVPMGTKFTSKTGISFGIYWENSWGTYDFDLSAIGVGAKIGWNSHYNNKNVMYSGDMTDARNGATEYITAQNIDEPYLILNNVFWGESLGSGFRVVVGKTDSVDRNYMMDPNQVWFTTATETIQKQSIVGLIIPEGNGTSAIVINCGGGNIQVSSSSDSSDILRRALAAKWSSCFYVNDLLEFCGATLVDSPEHADIDLTPSKLTKDSILSLFTKK